MPGSYRVLAVTDKRQFGLFNDPDYVGAHSQDFPLAQIVEGQSAAVMLKMPAGK
jgi:hypothetical protein